ncbi:DUF6057 family protein [Phocaeicola oris]|uniref:DUF6057 family protein n=1 Tax=Phocaeicola oris TaxID=2896850 RepID=UPI00234E4679|nr:DUF6057 family protein [Phocaeicola oris]MCE2617443.1 DUF6057 family protein [Phocaeicola oris]
MKRLEKLLLPVVCIIMTMFLCIHLLHTQEYIFYYREQQQIFLSDIDYIAHLLKLQGGLAIVIAQYFIQYFTLSGVGAIITGIISGISAWFLWLSLKKINRATYLFPLVFLPALFQCIYLIALYHKYEGLIALLFLSFFLWIYTLFSSKQYIGKIIYGIAISIGCYFLIGSIAFLFALCSLLYDVLLNKKEWYFSLSYIIVVLILAYITVSNGKIASYGDALWVNAYNEYYVAANWFNSFSWLTIPFVMICFYVFKYIKTKLVFRMVIFAFIGGIIIGYYIKRSEKENNKDLYTLMQLYDDINKEQWDSIINNQRINTNQDLHTNCLNLALSHKGILLKDLYKYPQKGPTSLMKKLDTYVEENMLFSHLYYQMGIVSEALNLAFGAEVGTFNGNPSIMKLLIKIRLIYGDYPIAEKYIKMLKKTYSYKDWATSYEKFLYNDKAIEADPELGMKRKDLPAKSTEFVSMKGIWYDLMKVLEANPEDNNAREYAIGFLLLQKDFNAIKYFVDHYYHTPILPTLPVRLQEAVISYSEKDMDYCRNHGVTNETIQRFNSFRQKVLEHRHSGNKNLKSGLVEYKDTFWYHILKS